MYSLAKILSQKSLFSSFLFVVSASVLGMTIKFPKFLPSKQLTIYVCVISLLGFAVASFSASHFMSAGLGFTQILFFFCRLCTTYNTIRHKTNYLEVAPNIVIASTLGPFIFLHQTDNQLRPFVNPDPKLRVIKPFIISIKPDITFLKPVACREVFLQIRVLPASSLALPAAINTKLLPVAREHFTYIQLVELFCPLFETHKEVAVIVFDLVLRVWLQLFSYMLVLVPLVRIVTELTVPI